MSNSPFKVARIPLVTSLVSTVDGQGRPNASPKSWWTPTSYEPPILVVSMRPDSDSAKNVAATGTFILHLPTEAMAEQVLHTAKPLDSGENELDDVGLEWTWFEHPKLPHPLPLVAGCPAFVCWARSLFESGDHRVIEAQVGVGLNFPPDEGIADVLIHRGRNRFVALGSEYDVTPY